MTNALAGWGEMAAAFALFLAAHVIPSRPKTRNWLKATLGLPLYIGLYSAVSLGLLAWLVVAAGRAPYVELWPAEPWQYWAPLIAMPLVCLLVAFGAATPNPFSLGGLGNDAFDPDRPGIAGVTRHPLLWAPTLWAMAHMVPNGDLAHVLLFAPMAVFGIVGMRALDRRRRREWGEAEWNRLAAKTSFVPFPSREMVTGQPQIGPLDWLRLVTAALLYLGLLHAHLPVIGVSPIPPM
jgi:uncharacterized membrane protein